MKIGVTEPDHADFKGIYQGETSIVESLKWAVNKLIEVAKAFFCWIGLSSQKTTSPLLPFLKSASPTDPISTAEKIKLIKTPENLFDLHARIKAKMPEERSQDEKDFLTLDNPKIFRSIINTFTVDTDEAIDGNHHCFGGFRPGHKCIYSYKHFEEFKTLCSETGLGVLRNSDDFQEVFFKIQTLDQASQKTLFRALSNKAQFFHETCALIQMHPNTFKLYRQESTPIGHSRLINGIQPNKVTCKVATFVDKQNFFQTQKQNARDEQKLTELNYENHGFAQDGYGFGDIDEVFTLQNIPILKKHVRFRQLNSLTEKFKEFAKAQFQYTMDEYRQPLQNYINARSLNSLFTSKGGLEELEHADNSRDPGAISFSCITTTKLERGKAHGLLLKTDQNDYQLACQDGTSIIFSGKALHSTGPSDIADAELEQILKLDTPKEYMQLLDQSNARFIKNHRFFIRDARGIGISDEQMNTLIETFYQHTDQQMQEKKEALKKDN